MSAFSFSYKNCEELAKNLATWSETLHGDVGSIAEEMLATLSMQVQETLTLQCKCGLLLL